MDMLMSPMVRSGGPSWELSLGRKDSRTASLSGSNSNIPAPNSTIQNLITLFKRQGLDEVDLLALSGGHTMGMARCVTFKQRLYNQNGNNQPDATLERTHYDGLRKQFVPKVAAITTFVPWILPPLPDLITHTSSSYCGGKDCSVQMKCL